MAAVAGASAFGWMLAYLRGPDVVAGWIQRYAGTDPRTILFLRVALFVIVGDFMGVVIVTTLAFGLITPPYGLSLLMASKFCDVRFATAMFRSLPLYVVFFATIAFRVLFPDVVLWLPKQVLPQSVGRFPNPSGPGYICP